jgi:hypothetical protein
MELTVAENTLIEALRRLPHSTAEEVTALVRRLADLPNESHVDWSDSWSDEDLRDFTSASVGRLDSQDEGH